MVNFSDEPRRDSINFFEQILATHDKIITYQELDNFVYELSLENGTEYLVWLTNKYTVSINDVVEKKAEGLDALVTISGWNGYTYEAKEYALQQHFGLFKIREFMGALNYPDPSQYYMGIDKEDGKRLYGEYGYKFD
ncbi:hypothetical protein V9Z57_08950 [Streptococcus suis]|uniref:hypothetical protein n=1 Tax=Streptococcus suis TaxID=1307 RepID=UPI000CF42A16|nr:hypothetical protein [Streptococcus suis]MCO8201413.1 hypothetical protein [Streptococcus suis]MCO8218922.1 hypothetical protein [Streptococcus suis]MCO8231708.1 hypothetical protein [Streptococcus suis]HEM3459881.1 hypothetical protein [Streptococcus suis]HEM3468870.1 hypothetical protein [Streptococcus suis]